MTRRPNPLPWYTRLDLEQGSAVECPKCEKVVYETCDCGECKECCKCGGPEEKPMSEMRSYRVRFRIIASYDMHTPLMHLPMQETCLRATDEAAAEAQIYEMALPTDSVEIESVTVDEHWTKYYDSLAESK